VESVDERKEDVTVELVHGVSACRTTSQRTPRLIVSDAPPPPPTLALNISL
jgi:hypothetical protein